MGHTPDNLLIAGILIEGREGLIPLASQYISLDASIILDQSLNLKLVAPKHATLLEVHRCRCNNFALWAAHLVLDFSEVVNVLSPHENVV
jgi:hypothetical protein